MFHKVSPSLNHLAHLQPITFILACFLLNGFI